ncbi:MAG: M56 family metallopeptidase [Lachnospiraceae bacterium]
MNNFVFFYAFLGNSFLIGIIGLLFLVVKRLFKNKLSCVVTYYISFVIVLSASFPFGLLISKQIKSIFSDIHTVAAQTILNNPIPTNHTLSGNDFACAVFCVWLIISLLVLLSIVLRYKKFKRVVDRWKKKTDFKSSVLSGVPVFSCKIIYTPMLVGLVKRELIIPETVSDSHVLDLICMHEVIHHKRNDILMKAVILTICSFNWFNPFLWILAKDNAEDCEVSCDLLAKRYMCEKDKKNYCTLLLSFAKQPNEKMLPITSFSSSYRTLSRRVNAMMNDDCDKKTSATCMFLVVCILLIFAVIITAYNAPVISATQKNSGKISVESNIIINGQYITPTQLNSDGNATTYIGNDEKSNDGIAYSIIVDDPENNYFLNLISDN